MKMSNRVRLLVVHNGHLLCVQARDDKNRPFYFLPGGGLEYGESFEACAVRELGEECAIAPDRISEVRLQAITEHQWGDPQAPYHEIQLICRATVAGLHSSTPVASVEDHISFHWLKFDELAKVDLRPSFITPYLHTWLSVPANDAANNASVYHVNRMGELT